VITPAQNLRARKRDIEMFIGITKATESIAVTDLTSAANARPTTVRQLLPAGRGIA
jgi:hypothetical protein